MHAPLCHYLKMNFDGGRDTLAHAVGRARACRASLSVDTETEGIDTSAHSVGHAHKRGNFVPPLCARHARACRASLLPDTEIEGHEKAIF